MRYAGTFLACALLTFSGASCFAQNLLAANNVGSMSTPAPTPAPAASAEVQDMLEPSLVAVGTVGAANVYYSYLAIGAAADSYVGGSYEAPLAVAIANEVTYLNEGTIKSLQAMVSKNGLSSDDKAALQYLIDTYLVLNKQAKELVSFISNKRNDGSAYQTYRTNAWERIRKLFAGTSGS